VFQLFSDLDLISIACYVISSIMVSYMLLAEEYEDIEAVG